MLSRKMNVILYVLLLVSRIVAMDPVTDSLKISLFTNPCSVLDEIYSVRKAFATEACSEGLDKEKNIATLITGLNSIASKYEKKNPIFLLGECTASGFCPCILTRSVNPLYRKTFEEKVSQKLIECLHHGVHEPVTFTSFGCGGSFSELIIIAKVLEQKSDAHMNIHLIEGNNLCYVSATDHIGCSRQMGLDTQFFDHNSSTFDEYIAIVKEKDGLTLDLQDVKCKLIDNCFDVYRKHYQMITWLMQVYPHAKLNLFIHEFTEGYLAYLEKNNIPQADVVSAADIQDEISILREGPQNYVILCKKTLEKKKAFNAWLTHDSDGVAILSMSNDELQNAEKIKDDGGNDIYVTIEKL